MINSIRVANRFISMLPSHETPEHTEGYEGFYHLIGITGEVEQTTVTTLFAITTVSVLRAARKNLTPCLQN